jgi:hypothetical protein
MLESNIFGVITAELDGNGSSELLVEDARGKRRWVEWERRAANAAFRRF